MYSKTQVGLLPVCSESCKLLCLYSHSLTYLYCGLILSSVYSIHQYRGTVRQSQATLALIVLKKNPQEKVTVPLTGVGVCVCKKIWLLTIHSLPPPSGEVECVEENLTMGSFNLNVWLISKQNKKNIWENFRCSPSFFHCWADSPILSECMLCLYDYVLDH